jgi:hypothetical protein
MATKLIYKSRKCQEVPIRLAQIWHSVIAALDSPPQQVQCREKIKLGT